MPPHVPSAVVATFDVLQTSQTVNLSAVILAALDVPREPIQYAATELLLQRASVQEHLELLRRLPGLPASARELAVSRAKALLPAFHYALHLGASETRRLALAALRSTGMTAPLSHLMELLQKTDSPEWSLAAETLRDIVDQLYDRWRPDADAAMDALRQQVLRDLEPAARSCEDAVVAEEIATGVLILGDPDHPVVRRVLWHGSAVMHEVCQRMLMESRHPGVLRFVTASLLERYPHPQVFVAVRERRDPEFIAALLRSTGGGLSSHQRQNLEQIDSIGWLTAPQEQFATIPPALQTALVPFVQATRLPRAQKAAALEWLLRHGTPSSKLAATEGLSILDNSLAQDVVRENIDAADPAVQAWATSRLRQCALPEAYALLAERLQSPHPEVSAAARRELASFNVERVLSGADEWSGEEARRAGQLLLMVDPDAISKLRHELLHPARQKRIRTAQAILRLGLEQHLTATFCAMAQDADAMVRRTAAELLEHIPDLSAVETLEDLLEDDHPRVRETAAAALERHPSASVTL